ncbi:SRPBCC family protein [Clavibacter tessellarius]|uniref:SRPBCC family protein n=1 Tax=Clavibacter tessellarius TaxID=31965 RepID=UPI003250E6BB
MDPDHTPGQAPREPSDPRSEHAAPARRGTAPALDFADATEARLASRELDEGMPASVGLEDEVTETRARFPSFAGALLDEAKASTVFLPYQFVFRRLVDLPAPIVWDAVSDGDMLSGWLAEATVEPREGGDFWFEWMTVPDRSLSSAAGGIVSRFDEERQIQYTFLHEGEVTAHFHFRLEDVPGGPRDRQTEPRRDGLGGAALGHRERAQGQLAPAPRPAGGPGPRHAGRLVHVRGGARLHLAPVPRRARVRRGLIPGRRPRGVPAPGSRLPG